MLVQQDYFKITGEPLHDVLRFYNILMVYTSQSSCRSLITVHWLQPLTGYTCHKATSVRTYADLKLIYLVQEP
jgi:hypothetical protein